jgi:RNA polymerase sigma factor (sigma-70 family)
MGVHDERDAEDARLLAAGDHATLIAYYFPEIETRVRLRVHGLEADDVVSNVLFRLWAELKRGKRYCVPFRVVVHNVIGWTIRAHFQARRDEPVPLPDDHDVPGGESPELDDPIEPILALLTERERTVFELRVFLSRSAKEVADALGMTPNAVDQTFHRAKAKIRTFFGE